ncbi:carboxylesterase/lipase family protein [Actinospica sp.]|jgi:para-nitrobenzyl esterase|uniref:carboxylesterase/lipase family protein n=1 Tax=Actinospica sp. TaxID=1872142 RepID=UPI002C805E76|nr:carboxylesterase/lipase family protein [Actinospica sp.]HWG24533.1 carboxylesterase/lipase family protein [Actinospica sp.]
MTTRAVSDPALVEIDSGLVRGRREGGLLAWRGIPYAEKPCGPLRLRAPQPAEPWEGTLEAGAYGRSPMQQTGGALLAALGPVPRNGTTSEDCLTINVLRQEQETDARRPVMVYIFGGANAMGTSATATYSGRDLVANGDVVFVTFNYRVGVFGFVDFTAFATETEPIESNLGLRDQVAALQWVRRNISRFGGDPENVTVFGESAGAIAVTTLLTLPAAAGLFHSAIAESSAPGAIASREQAAERAARLVEALGATRADAADVLRRTPAGELMDTATRAFADDTKRTPGQLVYSSVVDGEFLPDHPINAFAAGRSHPVPLIIGTNAREGSVFAKTRDNVLPTTPELLDRYFELTDPAARDHVAARYPGYPSKKRAVEMSGDLFFWYRSVQVAEGHSQVAPVWMYRYDHTTPLLRLLGLGATHSVELAAVFGVSAPGVPRALTLLGGRRSLAKVSERVQRTWLRFATANGVADAWPQYIPETRTTLVIDTNDRLENDPNSERRRAWDIHADVVA